MATELELLDPADKPALLAMSDPELLAACRTVLRELGFKVHSADSREDFISRFSQIQYQVVLIEECFPSGPLSENATLQMFQNMPMNQRRHAATFLIGNSFQTLNPKQAFQQSVHAVVNRVELASLPQILQKVIADNNLFLNIYRETQLRVAQGKA